MASFPPQEKNALQRLRFRYVIVDEAHRLKNEVPDPLLPPPYNCFRTTEQNALGTVEPTLPRDSVRAPPRPLQTAPVANCYTCPPPLL